MSNQERNATQELISLCNYNKLQGLLSSFGYPRQIPTPYLIERVYEDAGDLFVLPFAELVKEGLAIKEANRATGDDLEDPDISNQDDTTDHNSGFLDKLFSVLDESTSNNGFLRNLADIFNIGGYGSRSDSLKTQENYNQLKSDETASNTPWIIGGVVIVVFIFAIVLIKK